jgi:hypothetical protein
MVFLQVIISTPIKPHYKRLSWINLEVDNYNNSKIKNSSRTIITQNNANPMLMFNILHCQKLHPKIVEANLRHSLLLNQIFHSTPHSLVKRIIINSKDLTSQFKVFIRIVQNKMVDFSMINQDSFYTLKRNQK